MLSLSTNTGRAGSKRRSASQTAVSNAFCDGCALARHEAEHRAAVVGERLEVEHLRAVLAPARAAAGSCPSRCVPQTTPKSKRRGSVSSAATHGAAERLVAAFEQVDAKADLARAPVPASRCAGRRASSRPAAASRAACRARGARCAPRRCAPPAPRRASSRRTARPACTRCRPSARSSSSSDGQLTAPGRRSSANSLSGARVDDGVEAPSQRRVRCASAAADRASRLSAGHRQRRCGRSLARSRRAARSRSAAAACSAAAPSRRSGRCPRRARRAS